MHGTMFLETLMDNDVGMHIYQYLHPKDLSSFSSCSRCLRDGIILPNQLAKICMHHLPLQLGAQTNYLAEFREGHSFSNKSELLDHVLEKTEVANLVLVSTRSMDESRSRAREAFLGLDGNSRNSTGKFIPQICETANVNIRASPITVECHYQSDIPKSSAISWTRYILDRDAFKKRGRDVETYQFAKAWLDCLFSSSSLTSLHQNQNQSNNNGTVLVFGMWRWSCKHQKLNGRGIAGVGVTMRAISTAVGRGADDDVVDVELRLTRTY